jgi:hypothetical protein
MRREGGRRGGSIAEPQAFEAGRSPQAIAEDHRFSDVVIHLSEVRKLPLARVQGRQRIHRRRHAAMAERCRHPEPAGLAYYAAPYSWQTPKSGRPQATFLQNSVDRVGGNFESEKGPRDAKCRPVVKHIGGSLCRVRLVGECHLRGLPVCRVCPSMLRR